MIKIITPILFFVFIAHFSFAQRDSLLESARVKQKAGKHEPAIADFSGSIQKHEKEVQAYISKWNEGEKLSDFERAEKGLELPPIDRSIARLYYFRGISYAALNKNEDALNDLNISIKINSKSGDVYMERGVVQHALGKKYEGCTDLVMARELKDSLAKEMFDEKFCWNVADQIYKEAITKLRLNQYQESFDLIQRSLKLCPDSSRYITVRGSCYAGLGKLDLALNDFDRSITLSPGVDAYFGRGKAYAVKGKHQESFNDFSKVIDISPALTDAYMYRAASCEGMNKIESALFDYQQVQRMNPKDAVAFFKSAMLRNTMNDKVGACRDFAKAASLGHTEAADYVKSSCK